jgi:hypothetical protein
MLDLVVLNQAELPAPPLGGLEVPPRVSLAARHDTLVRKYAAGDIALSRIHLPLPFFTARSSQKAEEAAVPNCSSVNAERTESGDCASPSSEW